LRYRLPRALVQLRQGVGRLVRSPQDRGVVVIADPGSPRYRAQVRAALADYPVEVLPWAKARVRLFETIRAMGLERAGRTAREKAAPPSELESEAERAAATR
jgi:ATP-dependent DNA helicase DinG